jgi:hypothetical protein
MLISRILVDSDQLVSIPASEQYPDEYRLAFAISLAEAERRPYWADVEPLLLEVEGEYLSECGGVFRMPPEFYLEVLIPHYDWIELKPAIIRVLAANLRHAAFDPLAGSTGTTSWLEMLRTERLLERIADRFPEEIPELCRTLIRDHVNYLTSADDSFRLPECWRGRYPEGPNQVLQLVFQAARWFSADDAVDYREFYTQVLAELEQAATAIPEGLPAEERAWLGDHIKHLTEQVQRDLLAIGV